MESSNQADIAALVLKKQQQNIESNVDALLSNANDLSVVDSMLAGKNPKIPDSTGFHLPTKPLYVLVNSSNNLAAYNATISTGLCLLQDTQNKENVMSGFLTVVCALHEALPQIACNTLAGYGSEVIGLAVNQPTDIMVHVAFLDDEINKQAELQYGPCVVPDTPIKCTTGTEQFPGFVSSEARGEYCLSAIGVVSCLLTKQITTLNYTEWIGKRWKAFRGCAAAGDDASILTLAHLPSILSCQIVYSKFSTYTAFRMQFFQLLFNNLNCNSSCSKIAKAVVTLSRGAELTHFIIIHEVILSKHPVAVSYLPLAHEFYKLASAFANLRQFPYHEWKHVKVLYADYRTDFLNRRNFPLLAGVAQKLGEEEDPALQNYGGGAEDKNLQIVNAAVSYIKEIEGKAAKGDPSARAKIEDAAKKTSSLAKLGAGLVNKPPVPQVL